MKTNLKRMRVAPVATLLAAGMIGCLSGMPSGRASISLAINGTYRATSLGNWAKTNNSFHDEPTVTSTWTVTSSCTSAQDCAGEVRSDQGWSAPLVMHDGAMWSVKREIPNWRQCPDGSALPGKQIFLFFAVAPDGSGGLDRSPTMAGKDQTIGPSGACRVNKSLAVEMPFRLDQVG